MHNYLRYLGILVGVIVLILIFHQWFTTGLISAGDLWPFGIQMYDSRSLPLLAWDQFTNNGFGGFTGPFLWIHLNFALPITVFGKYLGLNWVIIERISYFYPFLILSIVSPILLFKKLFPSSKFYLFSPFIFLLNTYILMIIGGGQIAGIGMAYALSPLVLYLFIKILEKKTYSLSTPLIFSLVISLQLMYDIRIAYITIIALTILLFISFKKKSLKIVIGNLGLSAITILLLNSYWLIPSILVRQDPFTTLGTQYSSLDAVRFFSFAKFENTFSLLHPNWPDNVFGKTTFMKTEFIFIPIIAYSSLLLLPKSKESRKFILYFAAIGLIGAFLAKGTNDPLGQIYIFLFEHFPGFVMFRDPTKWMVLVCLSFTILIPYSIEETYKYLQKKYK